MEIPWLKIGYELARLIITGGLILFVGGKIYVKYIQPELIEALGDSQEAVKNLAKLAGLKSQQFKGEKELMKAVGSDVIKTQIPELEALKLVLSPDTWEMVEDAIENNPQALMALYQKYGHLFGANGETQDLETDF